MITSFHDDISLETRAYVQLCDFVIEKTVHMPLQNVNFW